MTTSEQEAPSSKNAVLRPFQNGLRNLWRRIVVQLIARVLRTLLEGIAALDGKITEAAEAHPDFFIFQSFPGAGAALAPRLLAALGSQRDRYASAEEVQKYSGIGPVTEQSGKKKWVHFRWACPKFL